MKLARNASLAYSILILIAAAAFGIFLSLPTTTNAIGGDTPVITTIATGLHNPRGINFGPDRALYVAEAAGPGTPSSQCGVMGDGSTRCNSNTGSITRIDLSTGQWEVIVKGLPSLIAPNGTANPGTGIHDLSFDETGTGYMTIGFGANPKLRSGYFGAAGDSFARLGRFDLRANFELLNDLGAYEATDPDGNGPDTNPYGLLALPGRILYTDAGGNTLNQVAKDGISTLAVFPNRLAALPPPAPPGTMVPIQAVPTSVALGPDGDFYVGQLTGGPFMVGFANVYRVPADGGPPVAAYTGFTNIIDVAFGPDGSLYVLEIAQNAIPNFGAGGRIVRIAPGGARTTILAGPPLIAPGGIVVDGVGTIYVTNNSISGTAGSVLRIELVNGG